MSRYLDAVGAWAARCCPNCGVVPNHHTQGLLMAKRGAIETRHALALVCHVCGVVYVRRPEDPDDDVPPTPEEGKGSE